MSEAVNGAVESAETTVAETTGTTVAEATVENEAANVVTRNLRKTRIGKVISNKMQKTIVIAMEEKVRHPLYKKIMKRTIKFKAHDENNEASIGDTVLVMETRPLSKEKHWRLVNIVERAK